MDGKDKRLEIYRAIWLLQRHFSAVIQSMRLCTGRREFSVEDWVDFVGEAAREIAGCMKRGVPPVLTWSAKEFPEVQVALNEAMDRREFSWDQLTEFLCGVQEIYNSLPLERGQKQEDLVMDTQRDDGKENLPEMPAKAAYELVDARELSENEAKFLAWSAEHFDEEAFLQKLRLISPEAVTVDV